MKARIVILVAVVLLLVTTGVPQTIAPAAAQSGGQAAIQSGVASGGSYHLTSFEGKAVSAVAVASGGGYRLLRAPETPASGSGCCCTYLPCVPRRYP